ncbi:TRAFAC clade GTPase domain-containing protein [Virgisporangium ochraceum]|uniref:Double-GTPase 2 domain-containing protein n=1 Tax=Virgisporangium ochraceum TaxID=65505 RepID=A0A8J3ZX30_9ACTN|nr:hypothetical protein [Virgisporangium ochraceum]GIJ70522.1 hypothetical protein Voc01_054390 [Virgisporangium ochraceum]
MTAAESRRAPSPAPATTERTVTVTMLGAPSCGKTTYMLATYATLSRGVSAFSLVEQDHDRDKDLGDAWDRLTREGVLPLPTDETPQHHLFAFNYGATELMRLAWTDFRGGAMDARLSDAQAGDAAELVARLAGSDSIYLVLDSDHLVGRADGLTQLSMARRMTSLVRRAFQERLCRHLPLPSLAVLLTKADLLTMYGDDTPAADRLDRAHGQVRDLLPVMTMPGVTAVVCPVMVGQFGEANATRVDPRTITPKDLHLPVLFTAEQWLRRDAARYAAQAHALAAERQDLTVVSTELQSRFLHGLRHGGRIREAQTRLGYLGDAERQAWAAAYVRGQWADLIAGELREVPVYIGGVRRDA